ncbi:hypothetical protein PanWU01x14_117810 [Parasponia andersonii]|uniref:Uncharacterized protein n=1 Tax=Parasponia andersonii TaxID=3476 RepID=A0A2P5CW40_PARAD|nr:hypothetical protein PanWU01x14_117810 [Parasponia andersonii]
MDFLAPPKSIGATAAAAASGDFVVLTLSSSCSFLFHSLHLLLLPLLHHINSCTACSNGRHDDNKKINKNTILGKGSTKVVLIRIVGEFGRDPNEGIYRRLRISVACCS